MVGVGRSRPGAWGRRTAGRGIDSGVAMRAGGPPITTCSRASTGASPIDRARHHAVAARPTGKLPSNAGIAPPIRRIAEQGNARARLVPAADRCGSEASCGGDKDLRASTPGRLRVDSGSTPDRLRIDSGSTPDRLRIDSGSTPAPLRSLATAPRSSPRPHPTRRSRRGCAPGAGGASRRSARSPASRRRGCRWRAPPARATATRGPSP